MTNRRKHLPIMATVIGLALPGCGGGGGVGQTISVTVDSSSVQAIERALGIAAAIAPLAAGKAAPALPQITPSVERTMDGGVSVTVTAAPVGPDFEFLNSTPLDDVWSRAGLRGSETGSTEHITVYTNIESPRRPFGNVYTLDADNALIVDFATYSMRVLSSGFPAPGFNREYSAEEDLSSYVQNLLQKGFDHVAECCRGHGWRVDIRYRSAGHAQPPSGGLLHQLAFVLRQ